MLDNSTINTPINSSNVSEPLKKPSKLRLVVWIIMTLIAVFLIVQYLNAARYDALVQVIEEDRIGVNPTGERLDFGDLPRDKSAVRTITLQSKGNTGAYVIVWKRGAIADLLDVNKNFFTLEPGKTEALELSIYIPNSADFKYYRGRVIIFQIPKVW